jgi:acyl-CoA synthetase (AMP-forming)/AMP-acid ligase II
MIHAEPGPERLIFALLNRMAAQAPEATSAVDGERRLSYAQMCEVRDRYAKALLAAGVKRGDRMAMATPPCLDFWILIHAATSIGAIWVGINPRYQARDFEMLISDAKPSILVAVSPFEDRDYVAELTPLLAEDTPVVAIGEATAGAQSLDAFLSQGQEISDEALDLARSQVDPEDAAVIVYTSGTTGKPKGAMLSHRAIALSAQVNAEWMTPHDLEARCHQQHLHERHGGRR